MNQRYDKGLRSLVVGGLAAAALGGGAWVGTALAEETPPSGTPTPPAAGSAEPAAPGDLVRLRGDVTARDGNLLTVADDDETYRVDTSAAAVPDAAEGSRLDAEGLLGEDGIVDARTTELRAAQGGPPFWAGEVAQKATADVAAPWNK